ncbi:MAG: sigma-54-dependent transcriptional regulator [Myxococcota bacterium]
MPRILIVDDEQSMQEFLEILLQRDGHETTCCSSAEAAIVALESDDYDLVISDIRMPGMSGLELLDRVRELDSETLVVLITAHGTTESAVGAMKHGAYDYLTKPFSVDEIRMVVAKALEKLTLSCENRTLRRQIRDPGDLPSLVGRSPAMQRVLELVRQVSDTRTHILITGESGTGKEVVARAIHSLSARRAQPFVGVNCGAIPENLLESELFGHAKGAFTGASSAKMGLFEVADGGTLLLDEVGELPLALQVKLLRALQDRAVRRVGGTSDIRVDVRILSATNRDLGADLREGRFREDLYYRLNVIEVALPPLRERPEDLPILARDFVERFAADQSKPIREIAPEAMAALERYAFPGNVRELENLLERAVTLTRSERIELSGLPDTVLRPSAPLPGSSIPDGGVDLDALLADHERAFLREALERTRGVKKRAAELLGISFRSFRYRLEKLGLEREGE